MSPPRRFDWDEAQRLRALGLTYREIGLQLGVTATAAGLACDPGRRARDRARTSEWQKQGCCPDCGAQTTRPYHTGDRRCIPCAGKAKGTTAREGELRCLDCGEWKPDADFPSNRSEKYARRGRHSTCRACSTIRRREYRQRHREADNAYQRAYKRRKRAAA